MAAGAPARWASIAALTAMLIAGMCPIAWLLRLSSLVHFTSETRARDSLAEDPLHR
jgi:hypothetical protein